MSKCIRCGNEMVEKKNQKIMIEVNEPKSKPLRFIEKAGDYEVIDKYNGLLGYVHKGFNGGWTFRGLTADELAEISDFMKHCDKERYVEEEKPKEIVGK